MMPDGKVDMHIHTLYSDGSMSPAQIVEKYSKEGYDAIAITDHDGVGGIREAVCAGEKKDIKVIPGIELSTKTADGIRLHMLGYDIDPENRELAEAASEMLKNRNRRNAEMLEMFNKMGITISEDDIKAVKKGIYIGKPDFARILHNKGYVSSPKEAFESNRFLGNSEIKKIKKQIIFSEEAIKLIKGAGGWAVIAHPAKIKGLAERGSKEFYKKLEKLIIYLKEKGLQGVECYHKDHTTEEELNLVKIAERRGLFITRGSDYHGPDFE